MATTTLTADAFNSTVAGPGIVLVDFWAAWCGPCRAFGPVFEAASEKHPDITFAKVDTDAEQQLSAAMGISSIPTLMVFRDGVLVYDRPGAMAAPGLERLIQAVQELDMEQVRAEATEVARG